MTNLKIRKIIDLTHTFTAQSPTRDGSCGFDLPTTLDHHVHLKQAVERFKKIS